jgi:hypothetical protein
MPRLSSFVAGRLRLQLLLFSFLALSCLGFEFRPLIPWGTSPIHRYGHTMAEMGARVVLFGGASDAGLLNDLWVFNGMSSTWSNLPMNGTCLISPRYFHAAAKLSLDTFAISGGLSSAAPASSSSALSDAVLIRIDSERNVQCSSLAALPLPLYGHSMSSTSRGIILFGGYSRPDTGSSHVWLLQNASTDNSAKWLLLSAAGNPPTPRAFFVSGLLRSGDSNQEFLVIWGGLSTFGQVETPMFVLANVDSNQPAESGWKWDSPVLKGVPPEPRAYAASGFTSRTLCVHGGQSLDGVVLQDLWFLDRDVAGFYTWKLQSMPVSAPSAWGHSLTVFETSNQILFYGGQKAEGFIEHRMFAYLISSGEITPVNFAGDVPAARHSAALACIGSRLILHGGGTAGAAEEEVGTKDFASFQPMNDVWQFYRASTLWSPLRLAQPAVNIQNQSLSSSTNSSNLTAVTNNSSKSVIEQDVPRLYGHSMVNVGPIFVVFGGFTRANTSNIPVNQLHSLDPRQGRWTQLYPPTPFGPAARAYHAHALSPSATFQSSLVIFGGVGNDKKVLGDAWVIPLHLFQREANAADRMIAFDFNCRHVSFDTLMNYPLGSFSVSFWLFANVIPEEGQFLVGSASQLVKSSVDFAIHAMPRSCKLQVSLNVNGRMFVAVGAGVVSICDVGWHHIAFTYDGASRKGFLYIDGAYDAELTVPVAFAAPVYLRQTFFIGHRPSKSGTEKPQSCWSGFIDRFSFWNVSLSFDQVSANQFNSSHAFIHFDFDQLEFFSAVSKSSGTVQAVASFGSGNIAHAPALLPSSCPRSHSDLKFDFALRDSWRLLPSGPNNRSHAMMTAMTNDDIILFGGRDASGSPLSDLWILHNIDVPAIAKWEFIVPVKNSGSPMAHSIIGTLGQFQVVIIGFNSSSGAQVSLVADVGGFEKQLTRQLFDVGLPPAFGVAHCKCIDNILWAFGGQDAIIGVPFDGLFYSDLSSPFVPMQASDFSPPPLLDANHCLVSDTSLLIVGQSILNNAQESYLFSFTSQKWQTLNFGPRLSSSGGTLVSIQHSWGAVVVAFGGLSSFIEINPHVVLFNMSSRVSTIVSSQSAPNRTLHGALSFGGKMWIFGGQTSVTSSSFSNEIWTFSLQNHSWARVVPASSLAPPPIISHVFHPVGHQAVVVGGQTWDHGSATLVPNLHVWVFDFTTFVWSSASIANFAPYADMSAASHKQYLYVYGGHMLGTDDVSSNMWVTDTSGNVTNWIWKAVGTVGPSPRRSAFLGMISSTLLLYGGRTNTIGSLPFTDMWQYGIDEADPNFSRVLGPNSQVAYAGIVNYFDIELRNIFNHVIGNSMSNNVDFWLLFVGNSTRFRGTIEHRPDTIRVIFNPQYVGPHLAFLELNHGTISLSDSKEPFSINVAASSVDTTTSDFHLVFPNGTKALVDSTLLAAAGDSLRFVIAFQDKLNNVAEYFGRVTFDWYKIKIVPGTESSGNPVEYLDGAGMPPVEIQSSGGGIIFISGTLLEVANYSIIVKMGNVLVGAATYNFTLMSAAFDPQSSLVLLDESTGYEKALSGNSKYPVGETVRIVVLLRDRFGNNISYALEDNFFVIRITGSSVPPVALPEGKSHPLPEDVQDLLHASSYENEAFSLVMSNIVIEGLLMPKRIIRFFPFSLGEYRLHLATSDGHYVQGALLFSCSLIQSFFLPSLCRFSHHV